MAQFFAYGLARRASAYERNSVTADAFWGDVAWALDQNIAGWGVVATEADAHEHLDSFVVVWLQSA